MRRKYISVLWYLSDGEEVARYLCKVPAGMRSLSGLSLLSPSLQAPSALAMGPANSRCPLASSLLANPWACHPEAYVENRCHDLPISTGIVPSLQCIYWAVIDLCVMSVASTGGGGMGWMAGNHITESASTVRLPSTVLSTPHVGPVLSLLARDE